jgi:hypothetical protein
MLDQRGQLLRAALGFAGCSMPPYDRALWALRTLARLLFREIGYVAVDDARGGSRQRARPSDSFPLPRCAMEQQQWICPNCSKAILPDDTFVLDSGRLSHLDCKRPRSQPRGACRALPFSARSTRSPSASNAPRATTA